MSMLDDRQETVDLIGVGAELTHEITQLLNYEARLLDERRLTEWLDLLAEDLRYWLPIRSGNSGNSQPAGRQLAHLDHDKERTRRRIVALASGRAWAEVPPSRTRHLISNVEVRESAIAGEFDVSSAFIIYRGRRDRDVEIFSGIRSDRIRRANNAVGWELASRRITLDQTTILGRDLQMFF